MDKRFATLSSPSLPHVVGHVEIEFQAGLQTSGAKKQRVETEPVPKVIIRLTPGIDEQFRSVIRYRGDLSTMVLEAVNATDLETAPLVDLDAEKERLRGTTVNLPPAVHKR